MSLPKLRLHLLLLACLLQVPAFASWQLREYTWENPEFRQRFVGNYAFDQAIEPGIDREDSIFLREEVLPLLSQKPAAAIPTVEAYLEKKSAPALYLVLGNLYLERDLLFDAENAFLAALSRHQSFRRAHRGLAITLVRQERFTASIPSWLRVITLGGGDDQSFGLLGYAYLHSDQPRAALQAFQAAQLFAPRSNDLLRGEVESLLRLQRPADALPTLQVLIADQPEDPELRKIQANLLLSLRRLKEAAAALELAHFYGGADAASNLLLADLYLELDLPRLALPTYLAALGETRPALSPRDLIRILQQLTERALFAEAKSVLVASENLWQSPSLETVERADFFRLRALLALELDRDFSTAARLARESAQLDPLNLRSLLLAGQAAEADGDLSAARLFYERATRVPASNLPPSLTANAWIALGQLHLLRENYPEALSAWSQAQSIQPSASLEAALERLRNFIAQKESSASRSGLRPPR
ncbi:MAG: tetratricopeptide repeat protein [Puniceicoccaceae bacterium]